MDELVTINFAVWSTVVLGIMWATHSSRVCDGFWIKLGLSALAIGAAAQAVKPTYYSQLWIGISFAEVIVFFMIRIIVAKIQNRKPEFFAF